MKIKVDSFLKGDTSALKGATSDNPKSAIIKKVSLIAAEDLGFPSEEDRYQLVIDLDGEDYEWMPNKTSLKTFVSAFGDESDMWAGQTIKLYLVDQNVAGKMKKIVYTKI